MQLLNLRTKLHHLRKDVQDGEATLEAAAAEYWTHAHWVFGWRDVGGPILPPPPPQTTLPLWPD